MKTFVLLITLICLKQSFSQIIIESGFDEQSVFVNQFTDYEYYYNQKTTEQKAYFDSVYKDLMLHIDKKREFENIFNVFGSEWTNPQYSGIPLANKMTGYISNYFSDFKSYSFNDWKQRFEALEKKSLQKNNLPTILDQSSHFSGVAFESNGQLVRYNFPKNSKNYIDEISNYNIIYDTLTKQNRVSDTSKKMITKKLKEIQDIKVKFNTTLILIQNLKVVDELDNDALQLSINLSYKVITDDKLKNNEKIEVLLKVIKLLALDLNFNSLPLIRINFRRCYRLANFKDITNLKLLEAEYFNNLSLLENRNNEFSNTTFNILKSLNQDTTKISENLYLLKLITIAEASMNQVHNSLNRNVYYDQKLLETLDFELKWRITNLLYEVNQIENNHSFAICPLFYDRLYTILVKYFDFTGNSLASQKLIFHSINKQHKFNASTLFANIQTLPIFLAQNNEDTLFKEWNEKLNYSIVEQEDFLFLKHSKHPLHFNQEDKEFWLKQFPDSIINNINFAQVRNTANQDFDKILRPTTSLFYYSLSEFYFNERYYPQAYIFEKIGDIFSNSEENSNLYIQALFESNFAEAQIDIFELNREKDRLNIDIKTKKSRINELDLFSIQQVKDLDSIRVLAVLYTDSISKFKYNFETQKEYNEVLANKNIKLKNNRKWLISISFLLFLAFIAVGIILIQRNRQKRIAINEKNNAIIQKKIAQSEKDKAIENERIAIYEKKKSEAKSLAIGQIGHLCKSAAKKISTFYLETDTNIQGAIQALEHFASLINHFRKNRNQLYNKIEDEVQFAILSTLIQHPEFCEGKNMLDLKKMIDYPIRSSIKIPIYTLTNCVMNFFQHSDLNNSAKLHIKKTNQTNDYTEISIQSEATLKQGESTNEGISYIKHMLQLNTKSDNIIAHKKNKKGYLTIMHIYNERLYF